MPDQETSSSMRPLQIAGIALLVALALALASYFWTLAASPQAGRMDGLAVSRIRSACRFQALCTVRMGEIFVGDWDTFYEFGTDVPQSDVDQALGSARVRKAESQRLVVLTRNGHILSSEREPSGANVPLDGEVEFGDEHHREDKTVVLSPGSLLQVDSFPITNSAGHAGTFYVLRPRATLP